MTEYIEREALMRNLKQFAPEQLTPLIKSLIQKQPAADVVEVKHGKWLNFYGDYSTAECSVCGEIYDAIQPCEYCNQECWDIFLREYRYCPKCGAKMDGKGGTDT